VIQAAESAFLVAAESERGATVRASLVERAEPAAAVAEQHQVLAQQPHPERGAVRFRHFLGKATGDPIAAHHLDHRRRTLDAAQQVVVFHRKHGVPPAAGPGCLGL
jgi:hypothetical protein